RPASCGTPRSAGIERVIAAANHLFVSLGDLRVTTPSAIWIGCRESICHPFGYVSAEIIHTVWSDIECGGDVDHRARIGASELLRLADAELAAFASSRHLAPWVATARVAARRIFPLRLGGKALAEARAVIDRTLRRYAGDRVLRCAGRRNEAC